MDKTKEILRKYSAKIEGEMSYSDKNSSRDYTQFKQDMYKELSPYEKWSKSLGNFLKIKVAEKDRIKIQNQIEEAHIDISPSQVVTLSALSMLAVFFATIIATISIYLINGTFQILLIFLGLAASIFVFYYSYTMPKRLANEWKLKASSQMVPAILYIVVYMKHTSNLERAIEFASAHLGGPLALDFKKIFYDVEIGKFSNIKQSLDFYLDSWREYAPEFVESFNLIESSLFEPTENRRVQILEKALEIILDGIYEKTLKFSREIRSPLTNIYMLGIILPTLALALLPLASTLLGGLLQWYHVLILFNVLIPFMVFYMSSEALLKRPGGYGETEVLEMNPDYSKFRSSAPFIKAGMIALPLLLIGLLPFIMQIDFLTSFLNLKNDYTLQELGLSFAKDTKLFDFKNLGQSIVGPFSPIGVMFSFFIPLSFAIFFSLSYKIKTKDIIKSREETKKLEQEFTNSLFQLGNRLGDGIPAEIAFARVAESTQGQSTQSFFSIVNRNIQHLGMSLEEALFNKKRGALTYYPSSLISTSMKILTESVKKGLKVAARSLMSISEYLKNIQKINQRLKDLMAEIVSDMKSNMNFLAPLLSGVVVGLSVMISSVLGKLEAIQGLEGAEASGFGSIAQISQMFDQSLMIPPYFIQIAVGIYIVEIIYILSSTLVTIDSGKDPLKEKYEISKNLKRGAFFYIITASLATITLSILGAVALAGIG